MSDKELHHRHDKVFQQAMSNLNVARSMIKHYLPANITQHFKLNTLKICSGKFINKAGEQTQSDILYQMACRHGGKGYVYLLWEHQSSFDKHMSLRLLSYTCEIMRQHIQQGHNKLPLVFPMLIYNGTQSPYPGSTDFFDAFENTELAKQLLFKPFTLMDLSTMDDEQLVRDIWTACPNMILKHMRDDDFLPTVKKISASIAALYNQNGEKLAEIMLECMIKYTHITNEQTLIETVQSVSKDAGEAMTTLHQKWIAQGRDEGWHSGLNKGWEAGSLDGWEKGKDEGKREGKKEGKREGRNEAMRATIENMIKNKFSIDQIAIATNLPISKIKAMHPEVVDLL